MAAYERETSVMSEKDERRLQKLAALKAKQLEADDPWALPDTVDTGPKWNTLSGGQKLKRVIMTFLKIVFLLLLLYLFICSLDFLSSAFRLLGGKAAGKVFTENDILRNPVTGVMLGVLATVLVQSSSTSTSIVVTMVAEGVIPVKQAIPIIMGANIGTSVTNTIVSIGQLGRRDEFRRAFAGATVHDVFNWLSVIILLIVEVASDAICGKGYLFVLSEQIIESLPIQSSDAGKTKLLKAITEPFTKLVVQVDKKVIQNVALNKLGAEDKSVLKENCKRTVEGWVSCFPAQTNTTDQVCPDSFNVTGTKGNYVYANGTSVVNGTTFAAGTQYVNGSFYVWGDIVQKFKCDYLFSKWELSDAIWGIILLIFSLLVLIICLIFIVKTLHSLLSGSVSKVVRKSVNYKCPGKAGFLAGYLAILVGAGMTILVQSSSIFTSAMTPLVGVGVVSLDRMYPLTLGANIGTTVTAVLASLTQSGDQLKNSLQVAFCHLFFNITGILIWYPIPHMRKIPIRVAKMLGNTTAKYRWFAFFYLFVMFFLFPGFIFGVSLAGPAVFMGLCIPLAVIVLFIVIINVCQKTKARRCLPEKLKTWNFLPRWLHSLGPLNSVLTGCCAGSKCCRDKCGVGDASGDEEPEVLVVGSDNTAYVASAISVGKTGTKDTHF